MASGSPDPHGSRCDTAATAPAIAPRTAVAADASVDGSAFGRLRRVDREAAARAAVLRRAVAVGRGARFGAVFRAAARFAFAAGRFDFAATRLELFTPPAGRAPVLAPDFERAAVPPARLAVFPREDAPAARLLVVVLADVCFAPVRLPAAGRLVVRFATLPPLPSAATSNGEPAVNL